MATTTGPPTTDLATAVYAAAHSCHPDAVRADDAVLARIDEVRALIEGQPLATYKLSTLLQRAYDGKAGAVEQVAARAMVDLGRVLEAEGRTLDSGWAADTYLRLFAAMLAPLTIGRLRSADGRRKGGR